jgi:hypothetical protein
MLTALPEGDWDLTKEETAVKGLTALPKGDWDLRKEKTAVKGPAFAKATAGMLTALPGRDLR